MTDKNLADECERLYDRLIAAIDRYQVYEGEETGRDYFRRILEDFEGVLSALRASAAPMPAVGPDFEKKQEAVAAFLVDHIVIGLFDCLTSEQTKGVHREQSINELVSALRAAYAEGHAAGQAARAKRDVEIAQCLPSNALARDAAAAIEKDAAG